MSSRAGGAQAADIKIGHHETAELWGLTFNIDTIISTLIAAIVVLILGFLARHYLTRDPEDHVPSKLQLIWESIVGEVNKQVESSLGRVHPYVVPLAVALFFFILIANWLELLPTKINKELHLTPAPTADTNLTYALALMVMVGVWSYGIRTKGVKGYFRHFIEPYPVLAPLNILEELVKPITLALRLFGNIFAGGIMLALIGLMPLYIAWAPTLLWKSFDMVIGLIQAFIFALLTVLYYGMAAGHGHDEEDHENSADHEVAAESREATPQPVG
ncbi:MAG: F0F1 ATP synthase subunit A [Nocardioides sp.]